MQTLTDDLIDWARADAAVIPAPDLSGLVGFSPTDLVHNRAGQLSPTQRDERAKKTVLTGLRSSIVPLAFIAIWAFGGNLFFAAVGAIFLLVALVRWKTVHDDLEGGVVALAEGDAQTSHIRGDEEPDQWHLDINGLELQTEETVHQSFQPGGPYRVYYLPKTLWVVSAEALGGWRYSPPPPQKSRPWWSHVSIGLGE